MNVGNIHTYEKNYAFSNSNVRIYIHINIQMGMYKSTFRKKFPFFASGSKYWKFKLLLYFFLFLTFNECTIHLIKKVEGVQSRLNKH